MAGRRRGEEAVQHSSQYSCTISNLAPWTNGSVKSTIEYDSYSDYARNLNDHGEGKGRNHGKQFSLQEFYMGDLSNYKGRDAASSNAKII